ncbi:heat shock protein Hsp20 [mine drainage metagenome]|uniref:Heat shock protein Hsp20 n=1 Tax=mine drainage metagenome TaxID=410659 RepID=T0ZU66_9ZZZZ
MSDQNPKGNTENDDSPDDIIKFSKFISKVMTGITKNLSDMSEHGASPYSFNVKIGLDGMPVVENIQMEPKDKEERKHEAPKEPLVEVLDNGDSLVIVAELKGAKKEEIAVTAKAEEITIAVSNNSTIYSRNISLPILVDPARGKAKYNNGVLEVSLKKRSTKASYAIKVY